MTREDRRRLSEQRWHARDERCGLCGRISRCVDIDSQYVQMRICPPCATKRARAGRKAG